MRIVAFLGAVSVCHSFTITCYFAIHSTTYTNPIYSDQEYNRTSTILIPSSLTGVTPVATNTEVSSYDKDPIPGETTPLATAMTIIDLMYERLTLPEAVSNAVKIKKSLRAFP